MKKCYLFFIFVLCLLTAVGCSQSPAEPKNLTVISNVDSIRSSKSVEGDAIVGVLLKYHEEGTFSSSSLFLLNDENAFYLEQLDQTYPNGDGMKFNYVLYVPDCIHDVYEAAGGSNPNSGNPFWWYMLTYYGANFDCITGNWEEALKLLLENKESLEYPSQEDWADNWASAIPITKLICNASDLKNAPVGAVLKLNGIDDVNSSANPLAFYVYELKETQTEEDGSQYNFYLYVPECIKDAYAEGNGNNPGSGNPFWWYMKTYHDFSLSYIEENWETVLGVILTDGSDLSPMPDSADVTGHWLAN